MQLNLSLILTLPLWTVSFKLTNFSLPRYFILILAMKELTSMYTEGSLLFFLFLEGSIAAAKRCDHFVLEWNPMFLKLLWREEFKISVLIAVKDIQKGNYFFGRVMGLHVRNSIQIEGLRNQNSTCLKK